MRLGVLVSRKVVEAAVGSDREVGRETDAARERSRFGRVRVQHFDRAAAELFEQERAYVLRWKLRFGWVVKRTARDRAAALAMLETVERRFVARVGAFHDRPAVVAAALVVVDL